MDLFSFFLPPYLTHSQMYLSLFHKSFFTQIFLDAVPADATSEESSEESAVGHSYVKKKLEHGLSRIWQVSDTLTLLLLSALSINSLIASTPFPSVRTSS